jgi:hypothetical protein
MLHVVSSEQSLKVGSFQQESQQEQQQKNTLRALSLLPQEQ